MNRWLMAVWYDFSFQEYKQELTREEKMNYSVYASGFFFGLAIVTLFFSYGWFFLVPVGFAATGARKLQIYWNKRQQWDEDNKDYKADV